MPIASARRQREKRRGHRLLQRAGAVRWRPSLRPESSHGDRFCYISAAVAPREPAL